MTPIPTLSDAHSHNCYLYCISVVREVYHMSLLSLHCPSDAPVSIHEDGGVDLLVITNDAFINAVVVVAVRLVVLRGVFS